MIKIRSKNLEATEINHFKINLPECFHTAMNAAGRAKERERVVNRLSFERNVQISPKNIVYETNMQIVLVNYPTIV